MAVNVGDKVRVVRAYGRTPAVGFDGVVVEHDANDTGLPWRVLLSDGDRLWFHPEELTIIEEATTC